MKRTAVIILGDIASFAISFIILIIIRFNLPDYGIQIARHLLPFGILLISWIIVFYTLGLYDIFSIRPSIPYLKRWAIALLGCLIIGIFLFYFIPIFGISPKINLFIMVILFGIFSFLSRRAIYSLFSNTMTKNAVLIGSSIYLEELEKSIKENPQIGVKIINKIENLKEAKENSNGLKNLVIIIDNNVSIKDLDILNFYKKGTEVLDTAKAYEKYLRKIPVEYIDLSFVIEEVNVKEEISYKIASFIIEKLFAILLLIITSPILLISILAKRLEDKGPIFIKQKRIGKNGKVFDLYKIRSMVSLSKDGLAEKDGPVWSTGHNDPRITKVGKVLRKLHIDEIPQMINILKGDIALVGPRPERPEFVELLSSEIPYYSFRHIVKPGFTGWAQVKYYYANTVLEQKEKFEYDLYYIKNKNIFMDFGIFLRTVQIIFTH